MVILDLNDWGGIIAAEMVFCEKQVVQTAVLYAALPCGLNTVIFPRLVDENCQIGASLALISAVLSCITVPVVLTMFL